MAAVYNAMVFAPTPVMSTGCASLGPTRRYYRRTTAEDSSMRATIMILIALFIAAPLAQAEQFYKWQDDKGVWHFSATPPKGQAADKLKVRTQAGRSTDETEDEESDADDAEKPAATESVNCTTARNNLTVLNNNPVVSKDVDGDGVAENLSLEQHQEEISFAEQQIAAFCKPAPAAAEAPAQ